MRRAKSLVLYLLRQCQHSSFSYNFVAEKVSEATHAVTGDSNKDPTKESGFSITSRVSAVVEAVKDKAIEVKSEVLK